MHGDSQKMTILTHTVVSVRGPSHIHSTTIKGAALVHHKAYSSAIIAIMVLEEEEVMFLRTDKTISHIAEVSSMQTVPSHVRGEEAHAIAMSVCDQKISSVIQARSEHTDLQ
jgi:hypothetical protein